MTDPVPPQVLALVERHGYTLLGRFDERGFYRLVLWRDRIYKLRRTSSGISCVERIARTVYLSA